MPVNELSQLSKDPKLIAAASAPKSSAGEAAAPGSVVQNSEAMAPEAKSTENIRLDAAGNIIAREKRTVISDGSGNRTTITQGNQGGMTPELAARIAAGEAKTEQQRRAIWQFEAKRYEKAVVSGYQSKLKAMQDQLVRMEAEIARLKASAYL